MSFADTFITIPDSKFFLRHVVMINYGGKVYTVLRGIEMLDTNLSTDTWWLFALYSIFMVLGMYWYTRFWLLPNDLDAYYVLTTDLGSGDAGYASMDKEAFQEQRIADLGLSMDATREEIREAMHEKRFNEMREKLDLPNATEEEVREAKREQMGEKPFQNKGFRRGRMGPN